MRCGSGEVEGLVVAVEDAVVLQFRVRTFRTTISNVRFRLADSIAVIYMLNINIIYIEE